MNVRYYLIIGVFINFLSIHTTSQSEPSARHWQDRLISPRPDPLLVAPPDLINGRILPDASKMPDCRTTNVIDKELTLEIAIDMALCNNTQVRSTWVQIKSQAAAKGVARSSYLPVVVGSVGQSKDRTVSSDPLSPVNNNITSPTSYANLTWRLFDFGGRAANNEAAAALLDSAILSHDAAIQKTLAITISSFYETQMAKIVAQSKLLDEKNSMQLLETVKRREKSGSSSLSDVMRAQTNANKASLERTRAKGIYEKSLLSLIYNIGGTPDHFKKTSITGDLSEITAPAQVVPQIRTDLKEWLTDIKRRHPAILAAQKQVSAADQKVTSIRSEYMPTVDLTGNYFKNGRPNQSLTRVPTSETLVAITLNIPIFDGFSKSYQIQNALALAEQKKIDLIEVEHMVLTEFLKSYSDFEVALETNLSSESLLKSAQKSLDSMQRKLESGASDLTEVLIAQSALADARQQRIQTLAELRSARLRLFANSATLGRTQSRTQ